MAQKEGTETLLEDFFFFLFYFVEVRLWTFVTPSDIVLQAARMSFKSTPK